jgi:hypothetical protein
MRVTKYDTKIVKPGCKILIGWNDSISSNNALDKVNEATPHLIPTKVNLQP